MTAALTTELAVPSNVQYLAVWRLAVSISSHDDSAWERVRRAAGPGPVYLYVPAFSLIRPVVQQLGAGLTAAQPVLELSEGLTASACHRPTLVRLGGDREAEARAPGGQEDGALGAAIGAPPDFGTFSPVVVSRDDARVLAHFVYLAVESDETLDPRSVVYDLKSFSEELVFIPAVWDPRHIHESNWRLLLREFDGRVA